MPPEGATALWIDCVKDGDEAAVAKLWRDYFGRLVGLARAKLRHVPRRAADEEDVALSAFDSFCRGAQMGRFPQLNDRDDLWRLLVTITARKAYDLAERENRLKRGGGQVRGDSAFGERGPGGWEEIAGHQPTPEFAAQTAEEFARLIDALEDDQLQRIAVSKMEGYNNAEIAGQLNCSIPTVERRLRIIRKTWASEIDAAAGPADPNPRA